MGDYISNQPIITPKGPRKTVQLSDGSLDLLGCSNLYATDDCGLHASYYLGDGGTLSNTVGPGVVNKLAYFYPTNDKITSANGLTYNSTSNSLTIDGNLRIEGNLYTVGNVFNSNNISTTDPIIEIANNSPINSDMGLIMKRPVANENVVVGYEGNGTSNNLILAYTGSDAHNTTISPNTSLDLPVVIYGNVHVNSTSASSNSIIVNSNIHYLNSEIIITSDSTGKKIRIGENCGINSQYSNCIAIGHRAGETNQGRAGGNVAVNGRSIAIGDYAGQTNQKQDSVAIGHKAGYLGQGVSSVCIGNTTGTNQGDVSIAIGTETAASDQGDACIAIGLQAGKTDQQDRATAIGFGAGLTSQQEDAISIGFFAGQTRQKKSGIAIGALAARSDQQDDGIAIGREAARLRQQDYGISIGREAGYDTQLSNSIAIGYFAAASRQKINAIAIGKEAGRYLQNNYSIAIGDSAGINTSNASDPKAQAYTIAVGKEAGKFFQLENSIAIGYKAGVQQLGTNSIAIGHKAAYGGSDSSPHLATNTITLNATGDNLFGNTFSNATYIKPIREEFTSNLIYYNIKTGELTHSSNLIDRVAALETQVAALS